MKKKILPIVQQKLFDIAPIEKEKQTRSSRNDTGSDHIFDIVDALNAPILTFSQAWADTIPERMLGIVPMSRMVSLMKGEKMASNAEACIYIYTRSLEAPMSSDWTDIYVHVSCQSLQEWFGEDRWEDVKAPKKLSHWLQAQLDRLREHIYDKRRSILKERMRRIDKEGSSMNDEEEVAGGSTEQQSLF